jgi:hypothetical protein
MKVKGNKNIMSTTTTQTMPTNDCQFVMLVNFDNQMWAYTMRTVDGDLEVFDTVDNEDGWSDITSVVDFLNPEAEVISYITYDLAVDIHEAVADVEDTLEIVSE